MKAIMYEKISPRYLEKSLSRRPMFQFAVDEFLSKYKDRLSDPVTFCREEHYVFGAVLTKGELRGESATEDFELLMTLILKHKKIDIVVFDINDLDHVECDYLQNVAFMQWTGDADAFVELKDVYERRLVFARVPKEKKSLSSMIAC